MREINHLSLHQWLRSAIPDSQQPTSPIGFLFLKLPPPPCAVLLVNHPQVYSWVHHAVVMMFPMTPRCLLSGRADGIGFATLITITILLYMPDYCVDIIISRKNGEESATSCSAVRSANYCLVLVINILS